MSKLSGKAKLGWHLGVFPVYKICAARIALLINPVFDADCGITIERK